MQHLLFRVIELAMVSSGEGTRVEIALQRTNDLFCITLTNEQPCIATDDIATVQAAVKLITQQLNGTVDIDVVTGKPMRIALFIQSRLPPFTQHCSDDGDG